MMIDQVKVHTPNQTVCIKQRSTNTFNTHPWSRLVPHSAVSTPDAYSWKSRSSASMAVCLFCFGVVGLWDDLRR